MYSIIKPQLSRDIHETEGIWWYNNHLTPHTTTEINVDNGKDWYFRFDYEMS